jgi:hypothetical protein
LPQEASLGRWSLEGLSQMVEDLAPPGDSIAWACPVFLTTAPVLAPEPPGGEGWCVRAGALWEGRPGRRHLLQSAGLAMCSHACVASASS